jgi:hypothetical protein
MVIIFCNFRQSSAKLLAFLSKTNLMINIFAKTSISLSKKRQYFRKMFRREYFKNHNMGTWSSLFSLNSKSLNHLHDWKRFFSFKIYHPIPWRDSISRPMAPRWQAETIPLDHAAKIYFSSRVAPFQS